jgi:hypothetical protein
MTIDAILCRELRRRGRTWGVQARATAEPAATWSYPQVHEHLIEAVPDFVPIVDAHLEDYERVAPDRLFETLATFVFDARQCGEHFLVAKCLAVLDTAMASGDPQVRQLVASSFVQTIGPWDPNQAEFIQTWPDRLRQEAIRQAELGIDLGAA